MRPITRTLLAVLFALSLAASPVAAASAGGPVAASGGGTAAASGGGSGVASSEARTRACSFPFTATDATGAAVTVRDEPKRVVTLAPSAAQTMWEIGAASKVVGVSQYATYLDGAETRANVSGAGQAWVNVEKVVSLKPDLVLAPNVVPNATVRKLRDAGLTVYRFEAAETIGDVKQKTILTGKLVGACGGARETVDWMERKLSTVREAVSGRERPKVLYVFFGYTAGEGTFVHRVIRRAGGRNVAAMANVSGYAKVSSEVVVKYDPHWILLNDGATSVPNTAAYNSTYAVKHDQTVVVQEEHISQPAPRIVLAVTELTKALHPEAYRRAASDANATTTAGATSNETAATGANETAAAGAATTKTTTDGATGGSTPGLGVVPAVLALAAVALLTRRP